MKTQRRLARALAAALGSLGTLAVASEAHAVQYGELRIRSNTTLTDDRYGDVVFDASGITLDCANHQVHISSFTKLNDGSKIGIYADSKSDITVKNCNVVGGFDYSIKIQNSMRPIVTNLTAFSSALFHLNTGTTATNLNLYTNIALFIENETSGLFSATVRCVNEGIQVAGSTNTTISNSSISGCELDAIAGQSNNGLIIDTVDAENSEIGLQLESDSNDLIRNSTFKNNTNDGISVHGTNNHFSNNIALGNAVCDAYQDPTSTGDTWASNILGTICGSVPAAH